MNKEDNFKSEFNNLINKHFTEDIIKGHPRTKKYDINKLSKAELKEKLEDSLIYNYKLINYYKFLLMDLKQLYINLNEEELKGESNNDK